MFRKQDKKLFPLLFIIGIQILNIVTIIGVWRIFYLAEKLNGVLVVPDLTMGLEIYIAFPYMVLVNGLIIVAMINSRRKIKIDTVL